MRWSCRSFDLSLTGFDPGEIDALLLDPEEEGKANAAPPLPENPVSRPGDLWLCGPHRVLCGDATSQEAVARLLGARKPLLTVTDPPYGIELDSEWRDRAGLNGCGAAEPSYKKRTDPPQRGAPKPLSGDFIAVAVLDAHPFMPTRGSSSHRPVSFGAFRSTFPKSPFSIPLDFGATGVNISLHALVNRNFLSRPDDGLRTAQRC